MNKKKKLSVIVILSFLAVSAGLVYADQAGIFKANIFNTSSQPNSPINSAPTETPTQTPTSQPTQPTSTPSPTPTSTPSPVLTATSTYALNNTFIANDTYSPNVLSTDSIVPAYAFYVSTAPQPLSSPYNNVYGFQFIITEAPGTIASTSDIELWTPYSLPPGSWMSSDDYNIPLTATNNQLTGTFIIANCPTVELIPSPESNTPSFEIYMLFGVNVTGTFNLGVNIISTP